MPPSEPPEPKSGPTRVSCGVVAVPPAEDLRAKVDLLLGWMSANVDGLHFHRRDAPSYEDLAAAVTRGDIDVAWLPPIVYVRLAGEVNPLGSIVRSGRASYEAALIVRKDSKIRGVENLRGARAGWVDRWSAAGFVLPRMKLALLGIDPRRCFRTETFYGSHSGVVRALVEGSCDVAGTYAQAASKGPVTQGAWSDVEGADVRVLETFGAIPPDVLAARRGLEESVRARINEALKVAVGDERGRTLLKQVFGGDELSETSSKAYDSLVSALKLATARGLFD
jgi:phosphate/phosphite/phosphonate ABC transporter binding protein